MSVMTLVKVKMLLKPFFRMDLDRSLLVTTQNSTLMQHSSQCGSVFLKKASVSINHLLSCFYMI